MTRVMRILNHKSEYILDGLDESLTRTISSIQFVYRHDQGSRAYAFRCAVFYLLVTGGLTWFL